MDEMIPYHTFIHTDEVQYVIFNSHIIKRQKERREKIKEGS